MNTRKNAMAQSILLACALTVTACTGGASPPQPPESVSPSVEQSPSPTPSPSPTKPKYQPATAKGPAKNVPTPEYTALAHKNSEQGAQAFGEYYFQLMNYVGETNITKPIEKVTSRQCQLCGEGIIDSATHSRSIGEWQVGGGYEFSVIDAYISAKDKALVNVKFSIKKSTTYIKPDDPVAVYKSTQPEFATLQLEFEKGWKVMNLLVAEKN